MCKASIKSPLHLKLNLKDCPKGNALLQIVMAISHQAFATKRCVQIILFLYFPKAHNRLCTFVFSKEKNAHYKTVLTQMHPLSSITKALEQRSTLGWKEFPSPGHQMTLN